MVNKSWEFAEPRFCTGLNAKKFDYLLHRYESCFARYRNSEIQTLSYLRASDVFDYFEQPEENIHFFAVRYTKKVQNFATKPTSILFEKEITIRGLGNPTVARWIEVQASTSNFGIYISVFVNDSCRLNKLSFKNILLGSAITTNFSWLSKPRRYNLRTRNIFFVYFEKGLVFEVASAYKFGLTHCSRKQLNKKSICRFETHRWRDKKGAKNSDLVTQMTQTV